MRLSGKDSVKIADKIFKGKVSPVQMKSHTVSFGKIVDVSNEQVLDEGLITVMLAPKSYTCEDVVEISCHAGSLVLSKVLEQTLKCGARLAQPGEFTLRAFLNGRIDLTQAEGVADIIRARTEAGLRIALQSLEGKVSEKLNSYREELVDILAEIEMEIDFVQEEGEEMNRQGIAQRVTRLEMEIGNLLETFDQGRVSRQGLNIVIVGSPNVGKSSLLNAILGQDRAIVTTIPGTTRDTVSECINIKGVLVRLVDTAGFRISKNKIELEGIRRAKTEINKADLVVWVIDLSKKLARNETRLRELLSKHRYVIALNKIDLVSDKIAEEMQKKLKGKDAMRVSALQSIGIEELKDYIVSPFVLKNNLDGEIIISNLRHKKLLEKSLCALKEARNALFLGLSPEFVALDLRRALDSIGEIIGKVITDDILNRIFSRFCVGK